VETKETRSWKIEKKGQLVSGLKPKTHKLKRSLGNFPKKVKKTGLAKGPQSMKKGSTNTLMRES